MTSAPPPRPPPATLNSYDIAQSGSPYQNQFSSGFAPSYMNPYSFGAMNPYGHSYGPYGGGTGNLNYSSPEGAFIIRAEESSRGAFQSIESVVSAVASIANVLNSTHTAVFSSFRAVIGVVEQFRVLKTQFASAFVAVVRRIYLLWRRILIFLRLKPRNYASSDDIWANASGGNALAREIMSPKNAGVNWASLIFWLVALGGPYLIYKSVVQMVKNAEESRKWATGDGEHYTAKGLFDFVAANNQELSFSANEMLRVAPKSEQPPKVRDWLLASSGDGERIGLVPINYIKLINRNITSSPPVQKTSMLDAKVERKDYSSVYNSAFSLPRKI